MGSLECGGPGLPGQLKVQKYSNHSNSTETRITSPPKQGFSAWALLTFGPDDSSWLGCPGHRVCAAAPLASTNQIDAKATPLRLQQKCLQVFPDNSRGAKSPLKDQKELTKLCVTESLTESFYTCPSLLDPICPCSEVDVATPPSSRRAGQVFPKTQTHTHLHMQCVV